MSELLQFVLDQRDLFRRARLPSLYSDFTVQRYANPDGFAANTAAWIDVLAKAAQAGLLPASGKSHDVLSVRTGEDLLRSLETKEWGRPLALGAVINEAVSQHQMIPYEEFLATSKSIHSRRWTVQPRWLLSWGLKQLGLGGPLGKPDKLPDRRFVIIANVQDAANKILTEMANKGSKAGRLYPMSLFAKEAGNAMGLQVDMTESDLSVILKNLARDREAIAYDAQTVKFRRSKDTSLTLSEEDKTIASLKRLIADLNVQVAALSTRVSTLLADAQRAIQVKNRTTAMAALRSKKVVEGTLTQRMETLTQLEEIYNKIEQAADQVAVVRIMEASTKVLQKLHADVGGVERAETVVEGLKDEMQKVDEIGSVIEAGGRERADVDEDAVDEELEGMIRQAKAHEEEEKARQTQQRLADVGNVPQGIRDQAGETPSQKGTPSAPNNNIDAAGDVAETVGRLSLDGSQQSREEHQPSGPSAEAG